MKAPDDTHTPDFFGLGASTAPPPPAPAAHITDYRALGDNFRQREQVARKVQRWAGKFRELPAVEQAAIMEALQAIARPDDEPAAPMAPAESDGVDRSPWPPGLMKYRRPAPLSPAQTRHFVDLLAEAED